MSKELAILDEASRAIDRVETFGEAKNLVDVLSGIQITAAKQRWSKAELDRIAKMLFRVTALMGEYLSRMPKNPGAKAGKTPSHNGRALKELGISWNQSSRAQQLAAIPPEKREEILASGERSPTKAIQLVKREKKRADLEQKAKATPANPELSILNGDCTDMLCSDDGIQPNSARLIFADPPYNIGVDYGGGVKADRIDDDAYLDWCETWINQSVACLTNDGSLWVMICHEYAWQFAQILTGSGLHIRRWITWYETFGVNCTNNFNRTSRFIFYCVKDTARFVFNEDAVTRASDRQTKYADKRANPDGKIWDDVWIIPRLSQTCDERLPDFPTQLPLEMLRAIVGCASEPGDLVVDPFCGSGTTGEACRQLGRRFIGIEQSRKFATLARQRIHAV